MIMNHHLSDEDIRFFSDNGFLVVHDLLDRDAVESMRRAIDHIVAGAADLGDIAELEPGDRSVMRRIWSPSKRHDAFRNAQEDPRILDRLEGLIGPDIMFHHSKLNMKGPRVGSPVAWHQDMSYYPHTNSKLVACVIYLDDASEENGCVRVLSGSHKGPVYDHTDNGHFRGKVDSSKLPQGCAEVAVGGAAGCGVFLHCKVLHASEPNRSDRYRRVFIPAYRAADSLPIYFGPHAAHNEPGVYLLRGRQLGYATSESFQYPLPIAEKPFNSLFALQQGEHVAPGDVHKRQSGYATFAEEEA
jgi:ectoine hydroxylase-related dioxygenase (phytanoyl-CoA dioxygenase family)